MDEVRARRVHFLQIEAFEQRELLQHHRPLAPWSGLAHGVTVVVIGERRFDAWRPARHVLASQHAAVGASARVENLLGAAETIDRWGHETLRPRFPRRLDLCDAISSGALGLGEDAQISRRE